MFVVKFPTLVRWHADRPCHNTSVRSFTADIRPFYAFKLVSNIDWSVLLIKQRCWSNKYLSNMCVCHYICKWCMINKGNVPLDAALCQLSKCLTISLNVWRSVGKRQSQCLAKLKVFRGHCVSWPPSELIKVWSRSVDFPFFLHHFDLVKQVKFGVSGNFL